MDDTLSMTIDGDDVGKRREVGKDDSGGLSDNRP
jgi:hypothetical protein